MTLIMLLLFTSLSFADDHTAGLQTTWAPSYRALDLSASTSFGEEGAFNFGLTYQYTRSEQDSVLSTTNQLTAGVEHKLDSDFDSSLRGALTYWKNTENLTQYFGPTVGYRVRIESSDPDEILTASLTSDLFFYRAEVETTTSGATARRGTLFKPKTSSMKQTQYHPSLEIERTFLESVTPFLSAGYYFYSVPPERIENGTARRAQRYSPATQSQLKEVVGGFVKKNWEFGCRFFLPFEFKLALIFGRDQSATDESWSSSGGAKLSKVFIEKLDAELGISRVFQGTSITNYYTFGLIYFF